MRQQQLQPKAATSRRAPAKLLQAGGGAWGQLRACRGHPPAAAAARLTITRGAEGQRWPRRGRSPHVNRKLHAADCKHHPRPPRPPPKLAQPWPAPAALSLGAAALLTIYGQVLPSRGRRLVSLARHSTRSDARRPLRKQSGDCRDL